MNRRLTPSFSGALTLSGLLILVTVHNRDAAKCPNIMGLPS